MNFVTKVALATGIVTFAASIGSSFLHTSANAVAQNTTATNAEVIVALGNSICEELANGTPYRAAGYRAGKSNRQYQAQVLDMMKDTEQFEEDLFLAAYDKCPALVDQAVIDFAEDNQ